MPPHNKTLRPPSRAPREFGFATFCSRGLRLNVEPLGGQGLIMTFKIAVLAMVLVMSAWSQSRPTVREEPLPNKLRIVAARVF